MRLAHRLINKIPVSIAQVLIRSPNSSFRFIYASSRLSLGNSIIMIYFRNVSYAAILELYFRPLCFSAVGDEFYGLQMFDRTQPATEAELVMQLGIQGTCTLINYRSGYFVVFTRHQIAMIEGESQDNFLNRMQDLYVLMDDGRDGWNLPINGLIFSTDTPDDSDADDFVIAVVEGAMMRPFMPGYFFPVIRGPFGSIGDAAFAAGYPMHAQSLLMQADGNRTVKAGITGTITARTSGLSGMMEYANNEGNLNGMSGGPVFVTRLSGRANSNEMYASFIDGIIQRGGNGFIRYLCLERVLDKIDATLFNSVQIFDS